MLLIEQRRTLQRNPNQDSTSLKRRETQMWWTLTDWCSMKEHSWWKKDGASNARRPDIEWMNALRGQKTRQKREKNQRRKWIEGVLHSCPCNLQGFRQGGERQGGERQVSGRSTECRFLKRKTESTSASPCLDIYSVTLAKILEIQFLFLSILAWVNKSLKPSLIVVLV